LGASGRQALTHIEFPEGQKNPYKIRVTVRMTGGLYARGCFVFVLDIPPNYPFQAPLVTCMTRVWHPNISLHTGKVHLPILDKDWRPVLSINTVVFGLQLLFLEPNPDYSANPLAADVMLRTPELFREHVRKTLEGGVFFGVDFPCHLQQAAGPGQALSLKRKCQESYQHQHQPAPCLSGERPGTGAGTLKNDCTPPDSDLEAMCIQDPLEEAGEAAHQHQGEDMMMMMMTPADDAASCRKRPCLSPVTPLGGGQRHTPLGHDASPFNFDFDFSRPPHAGLGLGLGLGEASGGAAAGSAHALQHGPAAAAVVRLYS
jgi:ubiquitin-conjugating enzyme E2 M